ncbi:MAG TPA: integration host factor subunit beta [Alcanivoracaceae bacterium]|nr:integration host factor subunit beta [Alcanivoracaceae bacterium]
MALNKSALIGRIAARQPHLTPKDVEVAVKTIVATMSEALAEGNRIEIRGFGSFSLNYRAPRTGRNPRTGSAVALSARYVPHFKPGKQLREGVNASRETHPGQEAGEGRLQDIPVLPSSDY